MIETLAAFLAARLRRFLIGGFDFRLYRADNGEPWIVLPSANDEYVRAADLDAALTAWDQREGQQEGWRPIETYDKNSERWVLLAWSYWRSHPIPGRWSAVIGNWWSDEVEVGEVGPTHWMPLPALPSSSPSSTEL